MKLSAKPLKNFQNINSFQTTTEWVIRNAEQNTLYFQLVDQDQSDLRYLSQATVTTMQVTFPAVNPDNVITKAAIQPFTDDKSIWSVSLLETELPSSGNVQFTIVQDGVTRRFVVQQALSIEQFNQGGC